MLTNIKILKTKNVSFEANYRYMTLRIIG